MHLQVHQSTSNLYVCVCVCVISSSRADNIRGVFRYLGKHNLISRWRRIGLELELTNGDLDVIQRNRDSVEDRAAAMLDQWLTSGRATKQALVEAVQEVT